MFVNGFGLGCLRWCDLGLSLVFEDVWEGWVKFFYFGGDYCVIIVLIGVICEVVLMVIFSWKEFGEWGDFCDNFVGKCFWFIKFLFNVFDDMFLIIVVIVDNWLILCFYVGFLLI